MKKIISVILTLAIAAGLCISYSQAASDNFSGNLEFLSSVDVIADDEYKASDIIKTGTFINMVLNLVTDNSFAGNEVSEEAGQLAVGYGIIESMKATDISGEITYKEAVTMLTKAIGYRVFIIQKDYMSQAAEIGLTKGVSQADSEKLSAETAFELLVNACECEAVVANMPYHDSKMEFYLQSDVNALEYGKNIYKKKGTVTGNEYTTLYVAEGVGKDKIEIDGVTYLCDNSDYNDYIGQEVTYYVKVGDKNDEDEVKFITPSLKMEVVEIKAEDFENISEDFSEIEYFVDNDRLKTVKISAAPKVIFNGKVYDDYTVEDFDIDAGSIKIIKSSQKNVTDVVVIESYEALITDRISKEYKKIYNKFNFSGATTVAELEETDYTIIKNGEEIDFTDLKEWDVLSLAKSKSGTTPFIKILVSDFTEETKTEVVSYEDKEVTAIGYIYNISDSYIKNLNGGLKVGEELKIGEYQIYYLDVFENIVAVTRDYTKADAQYVYLTRIYKDETDDICYAKYYDVATEAWNISKLYKKVKINSLTMRSVEDVFENQDLFDADQKLANQLVKIKFNSSSEIKRIETATAQSEADERKFTKKQTADITYWTENNSFRSELFPSDGAKILCVPDGGGEAEDYYVTGRSGYSSDAASALATSVTGYDFDAFYRSDMLVVTYGKQSSITDDEMARSISTLFVVTGITQSLNSDDEPCTNLVGNMGNFTDLSVAAKDESVVKDVKIGDVLQLKIDANGKLLQKRIAFSPETAKKSTDCYQYAKSMYNKYFGQNARGEVAVGWIKDLNLNIASNENMVLIDSEKLVPVKLNGSVTNVIIYDAKTKKATTGTLEDMEIDDLMVVRLQYSVVKAIVVVKNL